ncbi:MAG: DUF6569 family protein [candidate division WOR-3 bacterium]
MKKIEIGEPLFQRNLLMYPLYRKDNGDFKENIKTIDEAYKEGFGKFEELKEPSVNRIIFKNSGSFPVFAIDGEEVIGAFQNRVINTAFFSEPNTVIEVPVSCVEERRWEGERSFSSSGVALYPSLRAILLKTTNKSLSLNKTYYSDQSIVWKSVKNTLNSLKISSGTLSIHDAFKGYESQIEWYLENLDLSNVSGLVAFAGDKFICMDLFISSYIFEKFKIKILRGYALDAILLRDRPTDFINKDKVKEIIEKVIKIKMKKFNGVGKGIEYRGEGESLIVRGFKKREEEDFLHLAVFPDIKL